MSILRSRPVRCLPFLVALLTVTALAPAMAAAQGGSPAGGGAPQTACPTCPIYAFGVNPDGVFTATRSASTTYVDTFTIVNSGNQADYYIISCSGGGGLVCNSRTPTEVGLNPGDSAFIQVTSTTGPTAGTDTIRVTGRREDDPSHLNHGTKLVPVSINPPYGLTIARVSANPLTRRPLATYVDTFTVTNVGTQADLYSFQTICAGAGLSPCNWTAVPSSQNLAPSQQIRVTVSYTTTATLGAGNTVTLRGSSTHVDVSTAYTVDVAVPAGPPAATLANANDDNLDRSLCLTSGAGEAAASQCGDLLVAHGMPAYATLGRDRALTLVYTSAQAAPAPAVAAWVTLGGTTQAVPTQVYGELQVQQAGTWTPVWGNTWAAWGSVTTPETRQIVLAFNAASYSTGIYPYRFLVRNVYAGSIHDTILTGRLLVVNRVDSRFGRGWGLAGVEQINYYDLDGTTWPNGWMLRWGGDGSVQSYRAVAPNVWVAPAGAYRDTLRLNGSEYTRTRRHGVQVIYDAAGRHVRTVSRTGQVTRFYYDPSTGQLDSVDVPPTGQAGTRYRLAYVGGKLDRITDPAGRVLDATVVSGELRTLTDPDNAVTTFTYRSDGRMLTRTSPRTYGAVTFGYANNRRLTSVAAPRDSFVTDVTTFTPWDERGHDAMAAVPVSQVYTKIDGPRTDVADTAVFVVDRWGAPTRTTAANGAVTSIDRLDSNRPALVTKVTYPGNWTIELQYNDRGNLTQIVDRTGEIGDGRPDRSTTFEYLDANAPDSPSRVVDALGQAVRYFYNSVGTTDSAVDARNHRTVFATRLSPTDPLRGLIDSAIERSVETWRHLTPAAPDTAAPPRDLVTAFGYDAWGNVVRQRPPTGVWVSYARDSASRVANVHEPLGGRERRVYDAMNRTSALIRYTHAQPHPGGINPLTSCDPTQVLCADSLRVLPVSFGDSVVVRYFQSAVGLDSIVDPRGAKRRFGYNARGQLVVERDEYDRPRRAIHDAAGNVVQTLSRPGVYFPSDTVSNVYNAMNRLVESRSSAPTHHGVVIPADTGRYTYDLMGRVLTAVNAHAAITRSYFADGSLKSQKTGLGGNVDSVRYEYTATGALARERRTSAGKTDVLTYGYSPGTGDLATITVQWGAPANVTRTLSFAWDGLGRKRRVVYPGSMTVDYRYDAAGLLRRVVSANPDPAAGVNDNFDFTYRADSVDAGGRTHHVHVSCPGFGSGGGPLGNACGGQNGKHTTNRYDRFGMLVTQVSGPNGETFAYDPAGSMIRRHNTNGNKTHHFRMAGLSNLLLADSMPGQTEAQIWRVDYTPNGARSKEYTLTVFPEHIERLYYYDGRGRVVGLRDPDHNGPGRHGCMRYDPDGQLIQTCDDNSAALLVHAGSNVAATLGSRWVFVHAGGIDEPVLGLWRNPVNPASWVEFAWVTSPGGRQLAAGALFVGDIEGGQLSAYNNGGAQAGGTANSTTFAASRFEAPNVPGLSVFRHRLYDQATGRWTQEDPIGIAGGVNLYQFNGNNPVSFTDPFGLSPCSDLRSEIDDLSAEIGGRIERYMEYYQNGDADSGHWKQIKEKQGRLQKKTRTYTQMKCDKEDDHDDWDGGTPAERMLNQHIPMWQLDRSHGYRPRPDRMSVPTIPAPTPAQVKAVGAAGILMMIMEALVLMGAG